MINVLDRITYYRKQKGWTEYQLAEYSGLTQSTISSWYRKDMLPNLASLDKICTAFGITISQFFATDSDSFTLTPIQSQILDGVNRLTDQQQQALNLFLQTL